MADTKHQRAVAAMLLCGKSTLQKAWIADAASGGTTREGVITDFGFGPNGEAAVKLMLNTLTAETATFAAISELLLNGFAWDGDEPHPPDEVAKALVAEARALDGE